LFAINREKKNDFCILHVACELNGNVINKKSTYVAYLLGFYDEMSDDLAGELDNVGAASAPGIRLLEGDSVFEQSMCQYRVLDRKCDGCGCPVAFCKMIDQINEAMCAEEDEEEEKSGEHDCAFEQMPITDNDVASATEDAAATDGGAEGANASDDESVGSWDFSTERSTTRTVGCPRYRKWFLCESCPDVDFCEACAPEHSEHACVLGQLHAVEEVCSNCDAADTYAAAVGTAGVEQDDLGLCILRA
jgi:hypothetical protein